MRTVRDLVKNKQLRVISVTPDETVLAAINRMMEDDVGNIIVMDGDSAVGFFTERDVVRKWAVNGSDKNAQVKDIMSRELKTIQLKDTATVAMSRMIREGIRHLIITEGVKILGVLSIRDVIKTELKELEDEVRYLKDYMSDVG